MTRDRQVAEAGGSRAEYRCDRFTLGKPCGGAIYQRWCRHCGYTTEVCEEHGGIKAVTRLADRHRADTHGEPAAIFGGTGRAAISARDPATYYTSGVRAGGASVPLGELQASPALGGRSAQTANAQRAQADDAQTKHRGAPQQPGRPTSRPAVVRRRRTGEGVD